MVTQSAPAVLGLVPSAGGAMNALTDQLYLSEAELGDPWFSRETEYARNDVDEVVYALPAARSAAVPQTLRHATAIAPG